MKNRKIELSQQLNFSVELSSIDNEKKTVSFHLSNETIVSRGWYDLQLLHDKKNVSFAREDILKVFYNHNHKEMPIGRWDDLRLENKTLKAVALFDKEDEHAMKIFGKVERGFIESVSVGIHIIEYQRIQKEDAKDLIIASMWEVYEISVVNIPAIPNAKVGLAFENEINTKEHNAMNLEEFKKEHPELFTEVYNLGASAESNRVKAIDKILKPDLAHYFTELKFDGKSTATDIELAQYRKIDELKATETENLNLQKKKNDVDGLNLGSQVLDMGLGGNEVTDEAKRIAAEKLENKEDEDAFFSASGVRKDG